MSATLLSIGEVAQRTGLRPATLRVWEARYGFPEPVRGPGGQRCYPDSVVELVRRVVADRDAGLALAVAVERARAGAAQSELSLHAHLRRWRPEVPVHRLTKRGLTAMSRALEDEGHNRAEQPVLVCAGFQHERHYRESQARWEDLSRGASLAMAFADFDQLAQPPTGPIEVPLDPDHPLLREWFVIWYGSRYSACLSARELPGQSRAADSQRVFETIWGVERAMVGQAAATCFALAAPAFPDLPDATLLQQVVGQEGELAVLSSLTNRMVAYLAAAGSQH